jgi:2-oxo-hept-3-ene-1,7-dioate hydratase
MMSEQERRAAAQSLLGAERDRIPVPQLSKTYPHIEIEDAYRIQDL